MSEPDEQRMIREAQAGSEAAFGEIVRTYLPNIYSFLARMTDSDTAEDLSQETFVKAWKSIRRFDNEKSLKPWLLAIAKNCAFDLFRKKRAKPFSEFEDSEGDSAFAESLEDKSTPWADEDAVTKETAESLASALQDIPPIYRAVILLRLEENLEFEEIAETLGRPIETVRSQYRRGVVMLKSRLIT